MPMARVIAPRMSRVSCASVSIFLATKAKCPTFTAMPNAMIVHRQQKVRSILFLIILQKFRIFKVDPNCEFECTFNAKNDESSDFDKLDDYELIVEHEAETEYNMVSSTEEPDSTISPDEFFADNSNIFFTVQPGSTKDDDFLELRGQYDV